MNEGNEAVQIKRLEI